MFHPDDETLAAVALGEDAGLTEAQLEHVRSCAECSATVDSIRQAASLVRAGSNSGPLVPPPPQVWSRIEAAIAEDDASQRGGLADHTTPAGRRGSGVAEPVGAVPARVRERQRARRPLGWAAGLAAAGIAIGLLAGRAIWQGPDDPAPTTVATAELDTLDTQQRLGEATLMRTDRGVDLRVATSTLDPGDGYLEVWLINTDGKRMVSVGVLAGDVPGTFPVSQTLLDQGYVVVDISREGFDERPEHSGDSLARGTLPT